MTNEMGQSTVPIQSHDGKKYLRTIHSARESDRNIDVDVYSVLEAFNVHCPAIQHALKKLLCAGIRGKASTLQDLKEAHMSISRAIQMQECREGSEK